MNFERSFRKIDSMMRELILINAMRNGDFQVGTENRTVNNTFENFPQIAINVGGCGTPRTKVVGYPIWENR